MGDHGDDDRVLATLPDGARVVSTLLTHLTPPQHVYRVVGSCGATLREYRTLMELIEFVGRYVERSALDRDG